MFAIFYCTNSSTKYFCLIFQKIKVLCFMTLLVGVALADHAAIHHPVHHAHPAPFVHHALPAHPVHPVHPAPLVHPAPHHPAPYHPPAPYHEEPVVS